MTASTSVLNVLPDDRRDRTLIKRLLAHLEKVRGRHWTSLDFPEDRIRTRDAVQVIAMEQSGRVTAVEHTLLDGFASDVQEAEPFRTALEPLERDPLLHVPGFQIDLVVPLGVAPSALEWKLLARSVHGWCVRHVASAPPGRGTHVIMVSNTALKVVVEKTACPGEPGRFSVTRAEPPRNFEAVIHERLQQKLGRLVAASADRRLMLFERNDASWNAAQLRLELEGALLEFPELATVNEVWMADTTAGDAESSVVFRQVLQNLEE